jgi:hypothetical protein
VIKSEVSAIYAVFVSVQSSSEIHLEAQQLLTLDEPTYCAAIWVTHIPSTLHNCHGQA